MLSRVPLFGAGLRGKSAVVTAQHRINVHADVQAVEDRTRIAFYGTPGKVLFADFGDTPVRGMIEVGDFMYAVHRGVFWEVNNAGVTTSRGSLSTTTGRVDMVYNGQHIHIVDGTAGYTYAPATTTFAAISDGDYPDTATTVAWINGYTIVEDGDEFQLSDLDNATSYDATKRASAESIPDAIVRVYTATELMLFGPTNVEFWGHTGALDMPFQRVGGGILEVGLAAKWSLVRFGNGVAFLGQNRNGDVRLYALSGGGLQQISTPDWETIVNAYSVKSDATGLAYIHSGHEFYQINFPTAGKSWIYDAGTGLMSEVQDSAGGRDRAEIGIKYINRVFVSDYENGKIYRLDPDTYTENGSQIPRELTSRTLIGTPHQPVTPMGLWFDFESGVGLTSGQGSDPQAMLTVSKDGGRTFQAEQWADMGAIGEYRTRVRFGRQDASENLTFRLRVTDPVKFALVGEAWADA